MIENKQLYTVICNVSIGEFEQIQRNWKIKYNDVKEIWL